MGGRLWCQPRIAAPRIALEQRLEGFAPAQRQRAICDLAGTMPLPPLHLPKQPGSVVRVGHGPKVSATNRFWADLIKNHITVIDPIEQRRSSPGDRKLTRLDSTCVGGPLPTLRAQGRSGRRRREQMGKAGNAFQAAPDFKPTAARHPPGRPYRRLIGWLDFRRNGRL